MGFFKDKIYEEIHYPTVGKYGCRAFSSVWYHDHLEVCKLILEYFDDNNPTIAQFVCSVMHDAAESDNYEVCEMIVNAAGIKNPANDDGDTPLHKAAAEGYIKICKLILENVADKCPIAANGLTLLHCSARSGQSETCEMILEDIDKEESSIQCFKCYVCKKELRTKATFVAHYAKVHKGVEPRGMTPYEYASISYPMTLSQYHIDKIFQKYLYIPETDPRTGERIIEKKT